MKLKRVFNPTLPLTSPCLLEESEAGHVMKVLRLKPGDRVEVIDGSGKMTVGELDPQGKNVMLKPTGITTQAKPGETTSLRLEICALKGQAMEWVIEKATELGVQELIPLISDHSVFQFGNKGPEEYQGRWQRIADQTLKQCERLTRMKITMPLELKTHLQNKTTRLWAFERSEAQSKTLETWIAAQTSTLPVSVLIGPEGGFSESEIELLFRSQATAISLGPNILRAETAALYSVSRLQSWLRA